MFNLLNNASKYSPPGSAIRVYATGQDGFARIAVKDEGAGIAPERQQGIFERFYRSRTPGEPPGIGLGLAIAREIVEGHGGAIGFDSRLGAGTEVWFTLPRDPAEQVWQPEAPEVAGPAAAPVPSYVAGPPAGPPWRAPVAGPLPDGSSLEGLGGPAPKREVSGRGAQPIS